MKYVISETFNDSASSFSPSLKKQYTVFQFHNDSINEIELTITPIDTTIDPIVIRTRTDEKFNAGDIVTEVPEFNQISLSQLSDGNFRMYFISKE